MKTFLLIASLTTACATAFAFPDYDSFSYPEGSLIGSGSWLDAGTGGAAAGPAIVSGGLSYAGLASSGGNSVAFGAGTENARLALSANQAPPTGGNLSVYFSYELSLSSAGTSPFQLTALDQRANNTALGSRGAAIMVQDNGSGTGFYIGMMRGGQTASTSSGLAEIGWVGGVTGADPTGGTLFSYNTTLLVVGAYNFIAPGKNETDPKSDNDTADLWVNPNASTFGNASAPTANVQNIADDGSAVTDLANVGGFDLIQGTGSPVGLIDDLRIDTSWAGVTPAAVPEPSPFTFCLLAVAAWMVFIRFRRVA
jgi:hypothetical protein